MEDIAAIWMITTAEGTDADIAYILAITATDDKDEDLDRLDETPRFGPHGVLRWAPFTRDPFEDPGSDTTTDHFEES